jgi:hypothetical protein
MKRGKIADILGVRERNNKLPPEKQKAIVTFVDALKV